MSCLPALPVLGLHGQDGVGWLMRDALNRLCDLHGGLVMGQDKAVVVCLLTATAPTHSMPQHTRGLDSLRRHSAECSRASRASNSSASTYSTSSILLESRGKHREPEKENTDRRAWAAACTYSAAAPVLLLLQTSPDRKEQCISGLRMPSARSS
jgi:hypothetical protein